MKVEVHKATDRGVGEHGWLKTRYSFSFADWFEPSRMGFGALRVLNDDWIAAGLGFGKHPHRDMEIITVVTGGAVKHQDNIGNQGITRAGDVQVMSAGTGVLHAEWNASETEPLSLFQIWINTAKKNVEPRYDQKKIALADEGLTLLVGPEGTEPLWINQDARLFRGKISKPVTFHIPPAHGAYIFVIEGSLEVAGEVLGRRDAIGIREADVIELSSPGADILLIDVPLA